MRPLPGATRMIPCIFMCKGWGSADKYSLKIIFWDMVPVDGISTGKKWGKWNDVIHNGYAMEVL